MPSEFLIAEFCPPATPTNLRGSLAPSKQTVLSEVGYGLREFPRDASICQHSVLKASTQSGQTSPLVVLDFTKDIRFCQNTCWGPYSNGELSHLQVQYCVHAHVYVLQASTPEDRYFCPQRSATILNSHATLPG